MPKNPRVRTLLGSQDVKGVKDVNPVSEHCLNLHGSIFLRFFDPFERKSAPKILSY